MKNKWIITMAATAMLALGTTAKAIQYSDADAWGINVGVGLINQFSSDFNIVTLDGANDSFTVATPPYSVSTQNGGNTYGSVAGYTPGQIISDGTVNFWFRDTAGDSFTITVGLGTLLTTAVGGPVSFKSDDLNTILIADLQTDGIINYSILNAGPGDITLDYALLTANVPDGGTTVMLLGAAISGLALIRRKLA